MFSFAAKPRSFDSALSRSAQDDTLFNAGSKAEVNKGVILRAGEQFGVNPMPDFGAFAAHTVRCRGPAIFVRIHSDAVD